MFKDEDGNTLESISIYSGINRSIFRKGVALTSKALTQKNMGENPYDKIWNPGGIVDIVSYVGMGAGTITLITGAALAIKSARAMATTVASLQKSLTESLASLNDYIKDTVIGINGTRFNYQPMIYQSGMREVESIGLRLDKAKTAAAKVGTAGKWLMGIGGALMVLSAALKGAEMYKFYHRTFSVIPRMIVEEESIVSYTKADDGTDVKNINFDQFAYYEVAKCNRQEIGIHTSAQNGVSDYESWGCGDAADLNADVGTQWLALYVNRAGEKGKPILADSLKLQKGKDGVKTPSDCNACLHMFESTNPVKIDDKAFCYREDNNGMYLFWKTDDDAYPSAAASAFNPGSLALAGIGGLVIGILGTTLVMFPKRKKRGIEAA